MANTRRKALYIFLTTLLGIMLFLMFHRSLFVIYDVLASFYPANPLFAVDQRLVFTIDFFSMLLAVFIGGWYGVWLGLNWYQMIYEERGVKQWFHGFVPHNWRDYGKQHYGKSGLHSHEPEVEASRSQAATVPKQIVVRGPRISSSKHIESFASFKTAPADTAWSFDDVAAPAPAKPKRKTVAKKRVAKKKVTK